MKSRIINMGDYTMDEQDRVLQQLFAAEPRPDNGFSAAVMKRIRRRELLRRLLLPAAAIAGGLVAFGPLLDVAALLPQVVQPPTAIAAYFEGALAPTIASVAAFIPPIIVALAALRLMEE